MLAGCERMLARLLLMGNSSPLVPTDITLTSAGVSAAGDGASVMDQKHFGYGTDQYGLAIGGASRTPTTLSGYTITQVKESITFDTNNGTFGTVLARFVEFALRSGAATLAADAFTSLTCPGGQVLNASAAAFSSTANGGTWVWQVTTNAGNETTADYLPSGTVSVAV